MTENLIIGEVTTTSEIDGEVTTNQIMEADILAGHFHTNKVILDKITNFEFIDDKFYFYEQSVPSSEWVVVHNLDKYPSVTVVDSAGSVVVGDVQYLSSNSVKLTFIGEFAGKVYCN